MRPMTVDYKLYPVLFVDDEPQNLVVFRYAMEDHFTVLTARSGDEALQFLRHQPIGVLLSDQRMPGMTGVELCARARQIQPDAVRIIVTAYADIHAAISAINEGQVSRYLVKPWRNEELMDVLRTCIDLVHLQHTMRDMEQGLLKTGQSRIATAVHDELLHEIANPLGAMTMTLFQASEMIDGLINRVENDDEATLPILKRDLLELREAHMDAIAAVEQLNALAARMRALPAVDPASGICDAGRVVDATVRILRRDVERTAHLQVVLERAPFVRVEASALGQVVLNLVLNAAQAIDGSGQKGRTIRIVVEAVGNTAVLSVIDDGPGISRDNIERIFEPYFTTKSTGTGLGLSIVREMVRRVGGQISVHSQPNEETTFRVQLPTAPPS
jgi:two-component system, NtrC family, sensor kinase